MPVISLTSRDLVPGCHTSARLALRAFLPGTFAPLIAATMKHDFIKNVAMKTVPLCPENTSTRGALMSLFAGRKVGFWEEEEILKLNGDLWLDSNIYGYELIEGFVYYLLNEDRAAPFT